MSKAHIAGVGATASEMATLISIIALVLSTASIYFQFFRAQYEPSVMVTNLRLDHQEDLVFDLYVMNGGNAPFIVSNGTLGLKSNKEAIQSLFGENAFPTDFGDLIESGKTYKYHYCYTFPRVNNLPPDTTDTAIISLAITYPSGRSLLATFNVGELTRQNGRVYWGNANVMKMARLNPRKERDIYTENQGIVGVEPGDVKPCDTNPNTGGASDSF